MARLILIILCGLGIGYALSRIGSASKPQYDERFYLAESNQATPKIAITTENYGVPVVELPEGSKFKFETMKHGTKMSHEFPLKNTGTAALKLENTGSTCKCTVGNLENDTLLPGQETKIKLEWHGVAVNPKFSQSATYKTNDAKYAEIKFEIEGAVIDSFVMEPGLINLGSFSADTGVSREFVVYCYAEGIDVERLEWSDPRTAQYIKIDKSLLTTEEYKNERPTALKAYRVVLNVLPGMQNGPVHGKVQLFSTASVEVDKLELPVNGTVVSDLSLIGVSGLDTDLNILTLGNVSPDVGLSKKVWLVVRGADHATSQVSLEQLTETASFQASLGEKRIEENRTMYPINIVVPQGCPEASFPGTGRGMFVELVVHAKSNRSLQLPIHVQVNVKK
jgi:Protein of unknown function (DUF1573)